MAKEAFVARITELNRDEDLVLIQPIDLSAHPEHPIVIPPEKPPKPPVGIWPGPGDPDFPGDGKPPRPPTGIWPGPGDPDYPVKPPGEKPPDGVPPVDWKVVWSPSTGWIVVGVPQFPHPAPSST